MYEVDVEQLVPADIVMLEPGMRVPSDMRLFEVTGLVVEEALLTGESLQVQKSREPIPAEALTVSDQVNMALAATLLESRGQEWFSSQL